MESEVPGLLGAALSLGLRVAGLSFHVGSGAGDSLAFRDALHKSRQAWDAYCALDPAAKHRKVLVDIGGGFSGGFTAKGDAYVTVTQPPTPPLVPFPFFDGPSSFFFILARFVASTGWRRTCG